MSLRCVTSAARQLLNGSRAVSVMSSSNFKVQFKVQFSSSAGAQLKPGEKLRQLVKEATDDKKPLQIVGAINAYSALMAEKKGHKALYLSGGGVAISSLGVPALG